MSPFAVANKQYTLYCVDVPVIDCTELSNLYLLELNVIEQFPGQISVFDGCVLSTRLVVIVVSFEYSVISEKSIFSVERGSIGKIYPVLIPFEYPPSHLNKNLNGCVGVSAKYLIEPSVVAISSKSPSN